MRLGIAVLYSTETTPVWRGPHPVWRGPHPVYLRTLQNSAYGVLSVVARSDFVQLQMKHPDVTVH